MRWYPGPPLACRTRPASASFAVRRSQRSLPTWTPRLPASMRRDAASKGVGRGGFRAPGPGLGETLGRRTMASDDETPASEPDKSEPQRLALRRLFEERLSQFPADSRTRLAGQLGDPELQALCFDPLPNVALALVENPRFGLVHARLLAAHHPPAAPHRPVPAQHGPGDAGEEQDCQPRGVPGSMGVGALGGEGRSPV